MSSARYQILHDTHYRYASPVSLAQQLAHLWPRACPWQRNHAQQLLVSPQPCQRLDGLDVFGNPLTRLVFERPHNELKVSARLKVEVLARPALDLQASPAWEQARAALSYSGQAMSADLLQAARFRFESPYVRLKQAFVDYAAECFSPGRPLLAAVDGLMQKIFAEFSFDAAATQVATPLLQVLEERRGVCQDFAHLMLACLRSMGLSARYVSGYLMMDDRIQQEATHAWAEAHVEGLGWVGFDVSNGISPDPRYVRVATGSDYRDAAPVTGISIGAAERELGAVARSV